MHTLLFHQLRIGFPKAWDEIIQQIFIHSQGTLIKEHDGGFQSDDIAWELVLGGWGATKTCIRWHIQNTCLVEGLVVFNNRVLKIIVILFSILALR